MSWLALSIAYYIIQPSAFFFFIVIITLQSMSFELANRIEQLTNKLAQKHKDHGKDTRIQEAKEQLIALQQSISRELATTQKRMRKIQDKLQRRAQKAQRQSQSVDQIWGLKQERVSEVIGGWISEYEEQMQQAKEDLNRQQLIYRTKLEQQQSMYRKEAKMIKEKIKGQLKTLQKELSKWQNINSQNHNAALSQLSSYKQMMMKQIEQTHQAKQRELKRIDIRLNTVKQASQSRLSQLRSQISQKSLRTNQIFELLLTIE